MLKAIFCICGMVLLAACLGSPPHVRIEKGIEINDRGQQMGLFKARGTKNSSPRVLLSMTTILYIPGKENFVNKALESLIYHHPDHGNVISRWLVINEYSNDGVVRSQSALTAIKQRFPLVETYQKTADEQGQARSLNMILDVLRSGNYAYWLHLEESWQTIRPFLVKAVESLEDHPYIHQLQLYDATYYLNHTHTRITDDLKVIALNSNVDLTTADAHDWRSYSYSWPAYSLRPSLARVEFLKQHPELVFDPDPVAFPVIFEFDFAIRWNLRGGTMCALVQKAMVRQEGHRSTYKLSD